MDNWIIHTKSVDIVVARYNENLEWLLPYSSICKVYNKGDDDINYITYNFSSIEKIANVGREAHTYLYHIIKNYDNLAKITLFTQGNILDHIPKDTSPVEYCTSLITSATIHGCSENAYSHNVGMMSANYHLKLHDKWPELKDSGYCFGEWLNIVKTLAGKKYNIPFGCIKWYKNAIFALDSKIIKSHPKVFYEKLIEMNQDHSNPELAHYFERAWYEIFVCMHHKD
jgi:hypothetical protein